MYDLYLCTLCVFGHLVFLLTHLSTTWLIVNVPIWLESRKLDVLRASKLSNYVVILVDMF
jgi:hypothetical protein